MNVWLVTTGSSDIQLKSDDRWNSWHQQARKSYYRLPFAPKQIVEGDQSYRIAPRVLGKVYEAFPDQVWAELAFPLLAAFTSKLQGAVIDKILLLVTDQSHIFDEDQRENLRCPYWQDTCALLPIFELYFQEHFPNAEIIPLLLSPQADSTGLDDWNQVLEAVRTAMGAVPIGPNTVYVSHQAGTPAISSAVQFSSLAKFGDRVRFLVSNEYRPEQTDFVESSSYLRGIQTEQAKKLLARHDYAGVQDLISGYLNGEEHTETKILLDAAIQWNFAKFDEFANELQKLSDQELAQAARERRQQWWWIGYEAAYLAGIRRNQGNIVEAFFHSFRAFEGIFSTWVNHEFGANNHIEIRKGMPYLKHSVLSDSKGYFSKAKFKQNGDPNDDLAKLKCEIAKDDEVELNLATICKLFRSCRSEYKQECGELKIFWNSDKEKNVCEKRNNIVHQVQGVSEADLWSFWGTSSREEWEGRLIKFLNFIAKEDLPEPFESLQEASLMAQVHQQLKAAIDRL